MGDLDAQAEELRAGTLLVEHLQGEKQRLVDVADVNLGVAGLEIAGQDPHRVVEVVQGVVEHAPAADGRGRDAAEDAAPDRVAAGCVHVQDGRAALERCSGRGVLARHVKEGCGKGNSLWL
jgi:hypothetical protein